MILDRDTDFVWIADTLQLRYPTFGHNLRAIFQSNNISYALLPGTKDIWCRDYMPVQTGVNTFVQFRYDPDYLEPKKYRHLKTNPSLVAEQIDLRYHLSSLAVDGGNIVKGDDCVIITDKVFAENASRSKNEVLRKLEHVLDARIVVIPSDPNDYTGHADGMVRYYSKDKVLVNSYREEDLAFGKKLRSSLLAQGFSLIDMPYEPYSNKSFYDATGNYINFLEMKDIIILPVYGNNTDDAVYLLMEELYKGFVIVPLLCHDIAKEGGVLNCVSWNILSQ